MEGPIILSGDILSVKEVQSCEEEDILEIIEDISGDDAEDILMEMIQQQRRHDRNDNERDEGEEKDEEQHVKDDGIAQALSNLTFAIGGAFHASTANLGSATAQLLQEAQSKGFRASFKLPLSPANNDYDNSSNHDSCKSLPTKWSDHYLSNSSHQGQKQRRKSCVDFGEFEAQASRLQYDSQDVFDIADNQEQFGDLQTALRSMGAITNGVLKQKLHWYIVNTKRIRRKKEQEEQQRLAEMELRQQQEQEEKVKAELQKQQEQEELAAAETERSKKVPCSQTEEGETLVTPVTETKYLNSRDILKSANDPSPTSIRDMFVPPS